MDEMMLDTADPSAAGNAMDDDELATLLRQFEAQSIGDEWGDVASEQEQAINYYYRRMPDVPAQAGQSSVVADTVQVTVDDAMAEVLKPFVSAEDFASFEPVGPEDEEQAEQANEYVNYVINCDNNGFLIFHNWFKDALLTKVGVVKTWWEDESRETTSQTLVDAEQLLMAREDERYAGEEDNGDGTYNLSMLSMEEDGRCKIECIPPEEFKISPFARSIEDAAYVAHAPTNVTRSTLVEMGYDYDTVYGMPAWSGTLAEEGRQQARYQDENYGGASRSLGTPHASQEFLPFREEYIRIDYDGDGIAELRKVHRVQDVILLNEEVEEVPFAILCPVPMPHKVYGLSLADQVVDLQRIETVLTRQMLDNLYKSNNPRPHVPQGSERQDGSTADSLMDTAPGAAVMEGAVPIRYEAVPFVADKSFPMLQYVEQKRTQRTGFNSVGQGLDRDVLNKSNQMTATQASQQENKQNSRAEMIARIFAETGVKRLMKLVLKMLVKHQPKARVIRLRNEWIEVDPRGWNPEMDLKINVGLGIGNKMEQLAQAESVLVTMAELGQTEYADLLSKKTVYNAVKRKFQAAGIKNIDDFLVEPEDDIDPETGQPVQKQQPPDPELLKAQAEMQMQQAKIEGEQQLAAAKLQIQKEDADQKAELARAQAAVEAQLASERAGFEARLAEQKLMQEMALAERRMAMEEDLADRKASVAEGAALSKNRPGGSLDE